MHKEIKSRQYNMNRRAFLAKTALGIGGAALTSLLGCDPGGGAMTEGQIAGKLNGILSEGKLHFAPKAKRVIYLFQSGGPSQFELFDHKPLLNKLRGQDLPESVRQGQRLTGMTSGQDAFPLVGSQFAFRKYGQSGTEMSDLLPYTSKVVDDICVIKSMHTEAINHDPAITFFQTGSQQPGRPCIGSWLSYGLGSMNENLPTFTVLLSRGTGRKFGQPLYSRLWGNGFGEPDHIYRMYGAESMQPGTFAANALLARRLAEKGVRFIQLYHMGWDQHDNLPGAIANQARDVDQASAALIMDLKQRGMLDDTLVVWGGEFGRTNYSQGILTDTNYGRDHHPRCFSIWMAGGGVKPGITYGKTDDFGYNIVENPVHVHDFQATLLHQLGINHEKFIYKYQGRRFRLTDVEGEVIHDILA